MNLKHLLLCGIVCGAFTINAQEHTLGSYQELDDYATVDVSSWENLDQKIHLSWGSKDIHYQKKAVPSIKFCKDTIVYAWRGERTSMQAVIYTPLETQKIALVPTAWTKGDVTVDASHMCPHFVNYVMTDSYQACGNHPTDLQGYLVPDCIDNDSTSVLEAQTTRPIWCTLEIPRDAEAGEYTTQLQVVDAETQKIIDTLQLRIHIADKTIPTPKEQQFHLDLWQQPYAVSRYYQVDKWSDEHLEAMRPFMKRLARAGQRVVSAILFYEPWGVQSHDKFDAMIQTTKKKDGTWEYDYTIFDRWVEFMESCGIDKQINCFSMVPWDMTFRYYDETMQCDYDLCTDTYTDDYRNLWIPFIKAFATHLKEKGWFEKTCIAMDERGLSSMIDAYNIVHEAEPEFKMSLAGNYHSELVDKLYDYCIAYGQKFSEEELNSRASKGYVSTTYTACNNTRPNLLTNNMPAETAYLPIFCAANDFDGYLHWAWINWAEDPLRDSRFRMFGPGDTYSIYPGDRSSVRFERFIEGIHAYEKIQILRKEYTENNDTEALTKLDNILDVFKTGKISSDSQASEYVNLINSILNDSPEPPVDKPDDYCPIEISSGNRQTAIEKRWVTKATTTGALTDLNYTAPEHSVNGWCITSPIEVKPDSELKLTINCAENDDDMRYCRLLVVADWNNDSIFNTLTNEKIARIGVENSANAQLLNHTITINVPDNAKTGTSRIRLCYADAWVDEPEACGELYKGFALDIPMNVVNTSSSANVEMTNPHSWNNGIISFGVPTTIIIYNMQGQIVDKATSTTKYDTSPLTKGVYIISQGNGCNTSDCIKFIK